MNELIPMEIPDPPEEQEAWLDEQERQKIREIEKHMQLAFEELFGGKHAKE